MKKILALSLIVLSGCIAPSQNAPIILGSTKEYSMIHSAYSDFNGTKTGKACAKSILGYGTGDSSIDAAKKDGNITKIATVSKEINAFFVGNKVCTIVTGN